jgi:transmembrane sensor
MNKQIVDEAAEWFVEFSAGDVDASAKQAFDGWLRKSPEHVRVYLEILPIWDDGAIPLPQEETTAEELIAMARGAANVVPLTAAARGETNSLPVAPAPFAGRWVIAASVALALSIGSIATWFYGYRPPTYATDIGQHRSVKLADGSTIELNTKSRVRIVFTEQARDVELMEGQALFRVAKDNLRPFTVRSGAMHARAVGTQFDVYRKSRGTTVTVLEGKVAVGAAVTHEPAAGAEVVLLSAGEQITLTVGLPAKPKRTNLATAAAWTQGRLIFDSMPLPEVAEEFNRYNQRRIVVNAAGLTDFHVNGSFRSSDPAALLRFLRAQPGIRVHETAAAIQISQQ